VAQIDRVIGAESELSTLLELLCKHPHRPVIHHPPLGMARFWPGIGVEEIEHRQCAVWNASEHLQRIAMMDADIAQRAIAHMGERLRHAIDEGFGADEAVIGQQVGPIRHMLAAAEPDFEMQRAIVTEQDLAGDRAFCGQGNPRQQRLDKILLPGAQRLALAAAVETVQGGRITGFVSGHGVGG
jgi:hypothetical protein